MSVLDDLSACCRLAYDQRLVGGTGGNMSVRIGDDVYITATGSRLGDVYPASLVKVSLDGTQVENGKPSKELGLHLGIYRRRRDVSAIAHLHPVNSIAVSIMADIDDHPVMPVYTYGYAAKIEPLGFVPLLLPGSEVLARSVGEAAVNSHVILMKNHGIIAMGDAIEIALSLIEETEQNAALHICLGGKGAIFKR